ncbi:transglutaminase-like domain-containing protein [Anaeromicropila populeti]|uniref:Transglutaminase-like superfamily protein n=1 Tax=Anaeromicropila populeti TaxID=37658 RepID=A0A1I6L4C7_9FIRM|nr:transglutaminase-like domain-containing protein [Anaeromicropila populeti]SFR98294.1 Transglutaminase-like superfamily protein [Anaeromicropila populeti]
MDRIEFLKKNIWCELFYKLNLIFFSCAVGFQCMKWLQFKQMLPAIISCSIVLAGLIWIIEKNKLNGISIGVMISLLVIGSIAFWISKVSIPELVHRVTIWLDGYQMEKEDYKALYAVILLLPIQIGVTAFLYVVTKYKAGKAVYCIGAMVFLVILGIKEISVEYFFVILLLYYTICLLVELVHGFSQRTNQQEQKQVTPYLFPFFFCMTVLIFMMPVKDRPISWKWIITGYENMKENVTSVYENISMAFSKGTDSFSLSGIGYGEEKETVLGGSINENDRIMLTAKIVGNSKGMTYLRGSVYDTYTGNGWKKDTVWNVDGEKEYQLAFKELLFSFCQGSMVPGEDEILVNHLKGHIRYNRIKTKTLFYPQYTYRFFLRNSDNKVDDSNSNILFSKQKKKGLEYSFDYFEVNEKSEVVKNYLRGLDSFTYYSIADVNLNRSEKVEELKKELLKSNAGTIEEVLSEEFRNKLASRENQIKKVYTQLPEELPERVREKADELTIGCENNFDRLEAIQKYLKAFPYTKQVKEGSEDSDFVDSFLFEQQEGYCTYFASAMTVLGRCIGIPTRYVEGIVADYEENMEGEWYQISSKSAHAWCEAYFCGYGWVRFDATPGTYSMNNTTSWITKKYYVEQEPEIPEFMKPEATEVLDINLVKQENQVEKKWNKAYAQFIIVSVFMIILLFSIMFLCVIWYRKRRFKNADPSRQIELLFGEMLFYLRKFGYDLELGETILQFRSRIGQNKELSKLETQAVWDIFIKVRYSNHCASNEEALRVNQDIIKISELYKKKKGAIRYLLCKIRGLST